MSILCSTLLLLLWRYLYLTVSCHFVNDGGEHSGGTGGHFNGEVYVREGYNLFIFSI